MGGIILTFKENPIITYNIKFKNPILLSNSKRIRKLLEITTKDMLPESYLCSKETENIRRLLKSRERLVHSIVGQKNEVPALLVSMGLKDEQRSLQSKKGRQKILDVLESNNDYRSRSTISETDG